MFTEFRFSRSCGSIPNLGFDDFAGFKTTRTGGLMVRSQKCRELIAHPDILAPCKLFLEPYCQTMQLHLTQIIRIGPGETAQLIHRDRWAWGSHLAHAAVAPLHAGAGAGCLSEAVALDQGQAQAHADKLVSLRAERRPSGDGEPHLAAKQRLDLVEHNLFI